MDRCDQTENGMLVTLIGSINAVELADGASKRAPASVAANTGLRGRGTPRTGLRGRGTRMKGVNS